ncbi:MAG TPA: hypothetical protein VGG71_10965, partial [Chitinophagaceae bacterium]
MNKFIMMHSEKNSTNAEQADHNSSQHTNEIVNQGEKKDERQKIYEEEHFVDTGKPVWNYSMLTEEDVKNYQAGTHYNLYEKMGSHSMQVNGVWGMYFCVWAPNATSVSVTGNFNDWKQHEHELYPRWDKSGIWEGFIPNFHL